MAVQINKRYYLGDFQLEPDKRRLSRAGEAMHLANRPFQVLLYLIERRDRMVTRDELLDVFWQGKDVYDVTLTKCVGAIRKAVNDSSDNPQFIETRYSEGYRYIGPLEEQITHGEPSIVEIERMRGVKIIVEEEEVQTAPPADEPVLAAPPAKLLRVTGRKRLGRAVTLGVVAATALLTISLILYSSYVSRTQTQLSPFRSIAVLPLKNLTGDPAQEYFSDGMTESLITELAKINGLKVISRGSAFTFKDKEVDPREVGTRLGVMAVLEGSIRKSGDRLRVEVRLVSTQDGRVFWVGDRYDRALTDVLKVQDEIGCSVAAELKVRLCGEEKAKRYTDNVEAYQAYLKGRYFLNKRTPEGITKGLEYFQRAIDLDPKYALAYAGLANCYQSGVWFANAVPHEAKEKTKIAARRAEELDESLVEAHIAMSGAYFNDRDLSNAIKETEISINLNPGSGDAHHAHAYNLITAGRSDDAIAEIRQALELDPLNVVMNVDVGEILLYARRYDEAIEALKKAIEMDSNRVNAHSDLALAYEQNEMYREAIAEYLRAEALAGASPETIASLKDAYAVSGMRGFWQRQLYLYKQRSKQSYFSPFNIAAIYARIGEKDQALGSLEKTYAEHSPHLIAVKVRPEFDTLRSDPRFQDLVRRVGLPD